MSRTGRTDLEGRLEGVVACVSETGLWVAVWCQQADLIILKARGASIPQYSQVPKFKLKEMVC